MSNIFYDHLVIREEITADLEKYSLTVDEREEIIRLVDENLHHEVLNTILTHLPEAKHPEFLKRFHQSPHDTALLEYLRTETQIDIEAEISKTAARTKQEILSEIRRSRKLVK